MHIDDNFLLARADCISCPTQAPVCSCAPSQQCVIIGTSCSACSVAQCVDPQDQSSDGGGVSTGAIAGAAVGALVLFTACVLLFIWYRRRLRAEKAALAAVDKPDVPARADDVLSRPDPVEKPRTPTLASHESGGVRMYSTTSDSTINLDPFAQYSNASGSAGQNSRRVSVQNSVVSNPFTDSHSIITASDSTQSTNVIPIALVPHGYVSSPPRSPTSDKQSSQLSSGSTPSRPPRSPELNIRLDPLSSALNLEHINVSNDSFRPPNAPYANSTRSGLSAVSSRASYMTSGSYSSDILSEAPQIVTPNSGAVRQVLGVAKAAVVLAPGSTPSTPLTADSRLTSPGSRVSRPPTRSPLAQTSFGPADAVQESDVEHGGQVLELPSRNMYNPFSDEHSPRRGVDNSSVISGNTVSTLGGPGSFPLPPTSPPGYAYSHNAASSSSGSIGVGSGNNGRPLSEATQAGSIIAADIGSAMLVRMDSTASSVRSLKRMTSGKLVSPSETPLREEQDQYLQNQQSLAMARARIMNANSTANSSAAAAAARRTSATSVASAGGDSILESFTFVPPSPIASRPPRSPLSQQAVNQQQIQPSKSPAPLTTSSGGSTTLASLTSSSSSLSSLEPPRPSFRQQQGLSTASQGSTGSALEGYTFHIDAGVDSDSSKGVRDSDVVHVDSSGKKPKRQRASLDTLALTADLSAFPLNFDEGRDSFAQLR